MLQMNPVGWLPVCALACTLAPAAFGQPGLLTDGKLHVILCGTGSPLPDPERVGSCTAVVAGGNVVLIDAGPGSWRKLALANVPQQAVNAIFLTHLHSDHIGDLGEAMTMSWTSGRTAPLDVYGPAGVDRVVSGFNQTYALDAEYRVAHHGDAAVPRKAHDMLAHTVEVRDRAVLAFERNGLKVWAFAVDHRPIIPAFGFRLEYGGRRIVITGDTAATPSIPANAKSADLLIHDAMAKPLVRMAIAATAQAQPRTAKLLTDILTYHASTTDAAQAAAEAGVATLVLSHLVPVPANFGGDAPFLKGVSEVFHGRTVVARDGMRFDFDPLELYVGEPPKWSGTLVTCQGPEEGCSPKSVNRPSDLI
jgi:ribonuclease Z